MSLTQFAAVAVSFLLIAGPPARAAPLKTVYTIPGLVDGAQPISALVKAGGAYYGTAPYGGTGFSGTIFKIDIKTGAYRIVHNFAGPDGSTPSAALLHYNSLLYGTTRYGGQDDVGTIFSFNPATGVLTSLASFTAGTGDAEPVAPLIAYNGLLYGTSVFGGNAESGTIFSFNPAAGTETTLYRFTGFNGDGAFPQAALTVLGNTLYGTTSQGGTNLFGTIFSFNPATGTEQSLYSFQNGADGGFPTAPLLAARRRLYGAASSGGTFGAGDVFSFDPSGARFTPVYSFTGAKDGAAPEAGLVALNGKLYGTASSGTGGGGTAFELDPATGQETTLHLFQGTYDGATPVASLIAENNNLVGTTEFGGFANQGAVFSIDIATLSETVSYNFAGTVLSDSAPLTEVNGTLYGVASAAGDSGYGLIYAVPAGKKPGAKIYSFAGGPDGSYPNGAVLSLNGLLYGTTKNGGGANNGTIFQIDPTTGAKTTRYSFSGKNDGAEPVGGLAAVGNLLYGTTYIGGASGSGTIFSFDPAGSTLATLYTFTGGADGALPWAPMIYANNLLYGTTLSGGEKNNGVVFSLDPATNTESTLYQFLGGKAGASPIAPVIYDNGLLYGITSGFGNKITGGQLYSLDPATGAEAVLFSFTTKSGNRPLGGLLDVKNILYGTATFDGPHGYGTVFSFDPGTGQEHRLYSFDGGANGGLPEAALIPVGNDLYGTTSTSAAPGFGTVFKLSP